MFIDYNMAITINSISFNGSLISTGRYGDTCTCLYSIPACMVYNVKAQSIYCKI